MCEEDIRAAPPGSSLSFARVVPTSSSFHVHVEVQHQQLGLLGAVTAAHRAHQFGVGGADPPHHAAAAPALQGHQVSDELARLQVPQFDRAVVGAGDDEVLVELEARDGALVLVRTCGQRAEGQGVDAEETTRTSFTGTFGSRCRCVDDQSNATKRTFSNGTASCSFNPAALNHV